MPAGPPRLRHPEMVRYVRIKQTLFLFILQIGHTSSRIIVIRFGRGGVCRSTRRGVTSGKGATGGTGGEVPHLVQQ